MLRKIPYIGGVKLWKRIGSLALLIGGYFLGNIIIPNIFALGPSLGFNTSIIRINKYFW